MASIEKMKQKFLKIEQEDLEEEEEEDEKEKELEENFDLSKIDEIIGGEKIEEIKQCKNKKCNSKLFLIEHIQDRAADEPMSTYVKCQICSIQWKFK